MIDTVLLCEVCSAELCWEDCDKGHADCYQIVCDNPLGCGHITRDCEDQPFLLTVRLHANQRFTTKAQAEEYANVWLDRLADLDTPHTWNDCDWEIKERK